MKYCKGSFGKTSGGAYMEIEKIVISDMVTLAVKTVQPTSFISRGNQEPCWGENIYIHEKRDQTKRNVCSN